MKKKLEKNNVIKTNLLISLREIKKVMMARKEVFIAYPQKHLKLNSTLDSSKCLDSLSKEFQDVFQDPPKGLPPLRGIEHQNDFILGASLPNRPTYRTNLD